jgi:hypothetical protein
VELSELPFLDLIPAYDHRTSVVSASLEVVIERRSIEFWDKLFWAYRGALTMFCFLHGGRQRSEIVSRNFVSRCNAFGEGI